MHALKVRESTEVELPFHTFLPVPISLGDVTKLWNREKPVTHAGVTEYTQLLYTICCFCFKSFTLNIYVVICQKIIICTFSIKTKNDIEEWEREREKYGRHVCVERKVAALSTCRHCSIQNTVHQSSPVVLTWRTSSVERRRSRRGKWAF